MSKITVVLADHRTIVRNAIRLLLEQESDIEVVGEVETSTEAVALAGHLNPSVVLMDMEIPGMSALRATRSIAQDSEAVRVLLVAMKPKNFHVGQSKMYGAAGYMPKRLTPERLIEAVRSIAGGRPFFLQAA